MLNFLNKKKETLTLSTKYYVLYYGKCTVLKQPVVEMGLGVLGGGEGLGEGRRGRMPAGGGWALH